MAEARSQTQWAHTSALLALLANVHRDPKKGRAFTPADFSPHGRKSAAAAPRPLPADLSLLKTIFVDRKAPV